MKTSSRKGAPPALWQRGRAQLWIHQTSYKITHWDVLIECVKRSQPQTWTGLRSADLKIWTELDFHGLPELFWVYFFYKGGLQCADCSVCLYMLMCVILAPCTRLLCICIYIYFAFLIVFLTHLEIWIGLGLAEMENYCWSLTQQDHLFV